MSASDIALEAASRRFGSLRRPVLEAIILSEAGVADVGGGPLVVVVVPEPAQPVMASESTRAREVNAN
ncbi:AMP-dependent synthetase and ligase [Anopheles sinensis]|uniref:AMP-dependent synthetase and ligase n=1 Tax=Anopheles sinensis TaxID=74873 RepID=A0A084WF41_ANOSI|nr:AMP-dependent synthetase and ligase [Anopheles sinensis]